jgi:hypothetical protein
MIDFVTTTHFGRACKEFPWRTRKMLVFPEYHALSSGIEKQVRDFQQEIDARHEETTDDIAKIEQETGKSFQDVQTRIDTFVVLMFTVVAVLFAGLGIVATKSSESSMAAVSVSLIVIASVALYFALRPYYLIWKLTKNSLIQPADAKGDRNSFNQFRSLLQLGWTEIVLASVLILASAGIDAWSVWNVKATVRGVNNAQSLSSQAIQNTQAQKSEMEQRVRELHAKYDSQ